MRPLVLLVLVSCTCALFAHASSTCAPGFLVCDNQCVAGSDLTHSCCGDGTNAWSCPSASSRCCGTGCCGYGRDCCSPLEGPLRGAQFCCPEDKPLCSGGTCVAIELLPGEGPAETPAVETPLATPTPEVTPLTPVEQARLAPPHAFPAPPPRPTPPRLGGRRTGHCGGGFVGAAALVAGVAFGTRRLLAARAASRGTPGL
eukprot:tig00001307_g8121.t1